MTTAKATKIERIQRVNAAVIEIGNRGRRFFYYNKEDRYAQMMMTPSGHLKWRDEYSDDLVHIVKSGPWHGFSNGGTLRSLVEAFAHYVRTGEPVGSWRFGPWGEYMCDGDLWDYGKENMLDLRRALATNPAIGEFSEKALSATIEEPELEDA